MAYDFPAIDAVCNVEFDDVVRPAWSKGFLTNLRYSDEWPLPSVGRPITLDTIWPAIIDYINSWGSKKVICGTDFPVIDLERARTDIEKLNLRDQSKMNFFRNNVIDLYMLDLPHAGASQ